jgi:hypothetical protein
MPVEEIDGDFAILATQCSDSEPAEDDQLERALHDAHSQAKDQVRRQMTRTRQAVERPPGPLSQRIRGQFFLFSLLRGQSLSLRPGKMRLDRTKSGWVVPPVRLAPRRRRGCRLRTDELRRSDSRIRLRFRRDTRCWRSSGRPGVARLRRRRGVTRKAVEAVLASVAVMAVPRL